MFYRANANGYEQALPGIQRKTLSHGDNTLVAEFRMERGSWLPKHAHPEEQSGYLVSGHIRLTIGGTIVDVGPGDSWTIPANTEHGAEILDASVAVEVFSPVRKDYLP